MKPSHWLLLGGPAHGEVHEVFFSTKIPWEHKGRQYTYLPRVHNDEATGLSYVVGIWQSDRDEVDWLIRSRRPPPIQWGNTVVEAETKRIEG